MGFEQNSIVVIAVSYESDIEALQFADNITRISSSKLARLIIVDNSDRRESTNFFQKLKAIDSDIIHVKSSKNRGYFGGARVGLHEIEKNDISPDWIIVCNVDLSFKNDDFFSILGKIDYRKYNIGIVAPAIISEVSGRNLNPYLIKRPGNIRMNLYKYIFNNVVFLNIYEFFSILKGFVKNRLLIMRGRHEAEEKNICGDNGIYAAHGSCIIFSKEYFDRGGTLDYPMFLFGEEIFVAETAESIGVNTKYFSDLRLNHNEHSTTGRFRSQKISEYVKKSAYYLSERYFGNN